MEQKISTWIKNNRGVYVVGLLLIGMGIGILLVDAPYFDAIIAGGAVFVILFCLYILIFRKGEWKW